MDPTLTAHRAGIYNDGTESGSTSIDTSTSDGDPVTASIDLDTIYQIRFDFRESAGNNFSGTIQLEYNVDGAGWNDVTGTSTNVRAAASANLTDNEVTTQRLGGGGTFDAGRVDEANGQAANPNAGNLNSETTEVLFSVTFRSADLSGGENIDLRIRDTGGVSIGGQTTPLADVDVNAPAQNITPALTTQATTAFNPTIDTIAYITPGFTQQLATAFNPTVTTIEDQDIAPAFVTQLATAFDPQLDLSISPALVSQLVSSFGPTVAPGPVDIAPALVSQPVTAFDPALSIDIPIGFTTQLVIALSPTLQVGPVNIDPAFTQQLVTPFAPTVTQPAEWILSASPNIAASGENTTAQLSAPSGKTTADFDAGRIQDDENPADPIDVTFNNYTEIEWSIEATADAGQVEYQFRVVFNDNPLDSYTVDPRATVSAGLNISPVLTQRLVTPLAPTLATGPVDIAPGLTQNLTTAFAPTVGSVVNVAPGLTQQLSQAFSPTLDTVAYITPGLTQQLATAFAPTVELGAQVIDVALTTQPATAFDPTVTPGLVDISPALVSQLASSFDPVLSTTVNITAGFVTVTTTAFDPSLATGPVDLSPAFVTQLAVAYAPNVFAGALATPGKAGRVAGRRQGLVGGSSTVSNQPAKATRTKGTPHAHVE
jgi:hypothetical protein